MNDEEILKILFIFFIGMCVGAFIEHTYIENSCELTESNLQMQRYMNSFEVVKYNTCIDYSGTTEVRFDTISGCKMYLCLIDNGVWDGTYSVDKTTACRTAIIGVD